VGGSGVSDLPAARFEGSYGGDSHRLPPNATLECKICWWVYDPMAGDPVWQIPPGVAFADLPSHWRCPQCDGEAHQFMVVGASPA
jgi:rubredoxin